MTEPHYGEFSFRVKPHVIAGLTAWAATAVPCSAASAALTCFRVRAGQGQLSLAATDMERTVIAVTQAVLVTGVTGEAIAEAYIPAKKLQAILKEAPDADITVTVKKDRAAVTAGAGSWVLRLPDAGDYPELVRPQDLAFALVPREKFLAALRAVRHVVCKDAGLPHLTQVDVGRGGDGPAAPWCVTASDGTRFARAYFDGFSEAMTVPAPVLDSLIRLLDRSRSGEVGVAATEESLVFCAGPVVLAVARRSSPFPDMDKAILAPALGNDQVLSVDRDELAAAVRRVRVNADASTAAIALVASGDSLSVESLDKGGNSASEAVPAAWGQDKDRVLCVNHVFLAEALAAHPDKTCDFRLGKDKGQRLSAVLLQAAGITQVMSQMSPKLLGY